MHPLVIFFLGREAKEKQGDGMGELQFIFVHGLSGWGRYDSRYSRMPYWGMRGGDLLAFLREK